MIYGRAFEAGASFEEFVAGATANRDLWRALAERARIAPEVVAEVRAIPGHWRLLAIAEDWCGDAVNILPVVARLAGDSGCLDLRIVARDAWPGLMDRHLTNGSRSIPLLILLDDADACRAWWGPRPSPLQAWFEREGRGLDKETRYRELRRWYARDRGRAIAQEVLGLVRCGASQADNACTNVRSCRDLQAA